MGSINRVGNSVRRRLRRLSQEVDRGRRAFDRVPATAEFDRPERNLILTGIPRSGTSFVSEFLSSQPNTFCVNEVFYEVDGLRTQLARTRAALTTGAPVPNRYARSGKLSADTRREGAKVRFLPAEGAYDSNCLVGSNVNVPYLNRLPQLTMSGSRVVALVRDPTFTLASWNSEAVRYVPEYHVVDGDLHPRYQIAHFPSGERLERQAFLWHHYAQVIAMFARDRRVTIVCYEQLGEASLDWTSTFGLETPRSIIDFKNRNLVDRFDSNELESVRRAVSRAGLPELYSELRLLAEQTQRPGDLRN